MGQNQEVVECRSLVEEAGRLEEVVEVDLVQVEVGSLQVVEALEDLLLM